MDDKRNLLPMSDNYGWQRRWAKQRGLPRSEGHKQGAKVFKQICEYAGDIGISHLTFYAFSTETGPAPFKRLWQ